MKKPISVILGVFLLIAGYSHAWAESASLDWFSGFNSTNGNSDFSELTIANGNTANMEPGGGIHLYGGLIYQMKRLQVRASAGLHYDQASSAQGSNNFSRYPVDTVLAFMAGDHHFGTGITYHINPKLEGADIINGSVEFDNALGALVEYGYQATPFLYLGLRLVTLEYQTSNPGSNNNVSSVDADHLGINLFYQF